MEGLGTQAKLKVNKQQGGNKINLKKGEIAEKNRQENLKLTA